jgi:alpha-1,6-mannosyltransferase
LLATLRPDVLEVSDRLTIRSLGPWGRRHGVAAVMISHERLDRLAGQILPRRAARVVADFANRWTAANYDAVVCTTAFAREEFDRIDAVAALGDSGVDARLVIVGEGPMRARLERQASRLPARLPSHRERRPSPRSSPPEVAPPPTTIPTPSPRRC